MTADNKCPYDSERRLCPASVDFLTEMNNFQSIATRLMPSVQGVPQLPGVEVYGESIPLRGPVGGDHILFVDFHSPKFGLESRIRSADGQLREKLLNLRSIKGIMISDVAGHSITDAAISGRLHDAFSIGVAYELDVHGEITTGLFDRLNLQFHESIARLSNFEKYITLLYGEISDGGVFRYISAGHPCPVVFSREFNRLVDMNSSCTMSSLPLGVVIPGQHKGRYTVNQVTLESPGDIIVLFSDGLSDLDVFQTPYFPLRLEELLQEKKHLSARAIFSALKRDMLNLGTPSDDISAVIVKKL